MTMHALPNDYDAWALSRANHGHQNGYDLGKMARPYSQMAQEMASRSVPIDDVLTQFDFDPDQRVQVIFRIAAKSPDSPAPRLYGRIQIPDLPAYAHPPVVPHLGDNWLDTYINYATAVSPMTPRLFHEGAGLWLISLVIARRLVVPITTTGVFPNLFVLWIAPTTLFRKTTGLNIARSISRHQFSHLLTPEDTTHEALLADLAGMEPTNLAKLDDSGQASWKRSRDFSAQRGWCLDEMSGLLSSMGRDYNQGIIEALLRMYDCDAGFTRSTRGQGLINIRNGYLPMLSASTPSAMARHISSEALWGNGWWPRFALLTPEGGRPEFQLADWSAPKPGFVDPLIQLNQRLPKSVYPNAPPALTVLLEEGVINAWNGYSKAVTYELQTDDLDARLQGLYGRLPMQVIKVSTLLAAMDWVLGNQKLPRISQGHYARALLIVESWRASAHRALATSQATEYATIRDRVTRLVRPAGQQGVLYRDIAAALNDKDPKNLKDALDQMVDVEQLIKIPTEPGKPGRPGARFAWIGE